MSENKAGDQPLGILKSSASGQSEIPAEDVDDTTLMRRKSQVG